MLFGRFRNLADENWLALMYRTNLEIEIEPKGSDTIVGLGLV